MNAHAADLELARLCAAGDEPAWERFVREYRPLLYRAADALDNSGGARETADSLYADLYGVKHGQRDRQSLFQYFEGRSSLATWLRAVLAQRYVDRLRSQKKLEPLADDDAHAPRSAEPPDPDRSAVRWHWCATPSAARCRVLPRAIACGWRATTSRS